MIKNYKELQWAINHKEEVKEYLKRIKTIGFMGSYGNKDYIGIIDNKNNIYTFSGIECIIGQDKLNSIVKQFEGLLNVELQNVMEEVEIELSKFTIIKNDGCQYGDMSSKRNDCVRFDQKKL